MAASRDLKVTLIGDDRTGGAFGSAGNNADGMGTKLLKLGGIFAGGLGVAAFTKTVIGSGMSFEATLNQMAAVADVPKAALGDLSKLALKMGADTSFSAQQAADAMLELSKGGLSAAQIKGGALKETLTLAAAGGLDLASAAGYMTNSLNTFGLKAGDAGKVAAALAGGANASTASVESLGMALGQVGPGALNAGLSLQETVAALAAFDNAGIKGTDAGTSLKTMLTRLVPQTKGAQNAMHDLGLDFTNADGSFVSLSNVSQQLQDKLGGLSAEQRTTALTTIFGSDATRAASVLMNEGAKGLDGYIAKTSDLGAANRVAASATSGTAGAVEQMKGSFETLATTLGIKANPYIRDAALRITEFLNSATAALPAVGAVAAQVGGVLAAAFTTVGAAIKTTVSFFQEHDVAARALGAVVATVAAGVMAAWVAQGGVATVNAAKSVLAWVVTATASTTSATIQSKSTAQIVVGWIAASAGAVASVAKQVAAWVLLGAQSLLQAARVAAAWLIAMGPIGLVIAAVVGLVVIIVRNWDTIRAKTAELWTWVTSTTSAAWAAVRAVVANAVAAVVTALVGAWASVRSATFGAWEAVKSTVAQGVGGVVSFVAGLPGRILGIVGGFGSLLVNAGRELIGGLIGGITAKFAALREKMSAIASTIKGFLPGSPVKEGPLTAWNNGAAGERLMGLLADGISSGGSGVRSALTSALDGADLASLALPGGTGRTMGRLASTAASAPVERGGDTSRVVATRDRTDEVIALLAEQNELLRRMPRDYQMMSRQGLG